MLKFLNPSNWSSLPSDVLGKGFGAQKKNILTSQFAILGVLLCLAHILIDFSLGITKAVIVDSSALVIFILLYIINENKFHSTAKILMIIYLNLFIGSCAYFIPQKSSLILCYFPIVCGTMVAFGRSVPRLRFILSMLPILLLIISSFLISDNYLFSDDPVVHTYTIVNIITAAVSVAAIVKFIIDINYSAENQLNKKESQLKKMAANISDQNIELKETNSKLDRFVYSASHDMRAPLTSMMGLVNLADKDLSPSMPNEYFDMMRNSIKKLDDFIGDIIDYSRNKNIGIKNEKIDFAALYNDTVESLQYDVLANNVEFKSDIEQEAVYFSDVARVRIILNNLISNAIKYRNPDSDQHTINFKVRNHGKHFNISVGDNGIGIEQDQQIKIFQMFHRASEKSKGSGLGLYIVKEIVDVMHGNISLVSEPKIGTKVTVKLWNRNEKK